MPRYSYKPCTEPQLGATIYEDAGEGDFPILATAHKPGMSCGAHNDLAEDICSLLTLVCVGEVEEGKRSIAGYARELERMYDQQEVRRVVAA